MPSKGKKSKKGQKGHPFAKKDWYDVVAPAIFKHRAVCKTVVNRSKGLHNANDSLIGRVFEVSLGDLSGSEDSNFRVFKLRTEHVKGKRCLTNFFGMRFTRDKEGSLIKKWQHLITCRHDVKTADGYIVRVTVVGHTKRRQLQIKKTTYAKSSHKAKIRIKMASIVQEAISKCDITDLVKELCIGSIGRRCEKECQAIFPLQNTFVQKVKVLRTPKFDSSRIRDIHNQTREW